MGSRYVPQTWANGSVGNTPLDAARLSYMESGIASAYGAVYTNVLDYGADPSGTNYSDSAINAALSVANTTVYIPPGTYTTQATLSVPENMHFIIDGTIISSLSSGAIITPSPSSSLTTIEGNGVISCSSGGAYGINPGTGTLNLVVRGLQFQACNGVAIAGTYVQVTGCSFINGENAVVCTSGAANVQILGNYASGMATNSAYSFTSVDNLVLSNNISTGNGAGAYYFFTAASYMTITGNLSQGDTGYGFDLGSDVCADFSLVGNSVFGSSEASFTGTVSSSTYAVILGNVGNTSGGITASGADIVHTNNVNA